MLGQYISMMSFLVYVSGPKVVTTGKSASILQLLFVPEVAVSAIVVIGNGSLFGFLNPTLEPAVHQAVRICFHFRMFLISETFLRTFDLLY